MAKIKPIEDRTNEVLKSLERLMDLINKSENENLQKEAAIFLKEFKIFLDGINQMGKIFGLFNSLLETSEKDQWDIVFESAP